MIFIGMGNTGSLLAHKMNPNALLFSTATQDTNNFPDAKNIFTVSNDGASKRFKQGERIWQENEERLKDILSTVKDEKVVLFFAAGGGSGSSGVSFASKILLENNCKILLIGILPYKKEINPPLANSVQSINSILPIINKVSLMLFDNTSLIKENDNDWRRVNKYILKKVDHIINMLKKYSVDGYSPLTLDNSELESVVFGGGFIDLSTTFLEDGSPKFEYGSLDKKTRNCLIALFVDEKIKDSLVDEYHNKLTNVISSISNKVANARMIPGIVRGKIERSNSIDKSINDRAYITIASGLSIDKYMKKIEKIRDQAVKKAEAFMEGGEKAEKIINSKESKMLDI